MRPHITYGKRSRHDAVDWLCECNTLNERVHKLIFDIPTFVCPNCMRKVLLLSLCFLYFDFSSYNTGFELFFFYICYLFFFILQYLDFHNFDFCLADVIVNGENLVKKVMHQGCKRMYYFCVYYFSVCVKQFPAYVFFRKKRLCFLFCYFTAECMPFAICQVMQIMHTVGCLLKKEEPDSRKLNLDPANLYRWYYKKYPHMKAGCEALGIVPSGIHKFVRITQRLRKRGIKIGVRVVTLPSPNISGCASLWPKVFFHIR